MDADDGCVRVKGRGLFFPQWEPYAYAARTTRMIKGYCSAWEKVLGGAEGVPEDRFEIPVSVFKI